MDFVSSSPFFSTAPPPLFQNFHINHTEYTYYSWRLLILSNEEKRMIMKFLKKEWFIWKFWKKGGSRENGGGGNEIHAPCTCDTVLRCTSKDWLARNQVNVSEWSDMSTRWLVSVSKHYKNHTKRVGLVQSWPNFHFIECNLFSPWYS